MIKRCGKSHKGFTLAELLIVVAIIAVLVAVAIPVFSIQLEKGREATDLANVRGAYAKIMLAVSTVNDPQEDDLSKVVDLTQKEDDWQSKLPITIAGVSSGDSSGNGRDSNWVGVPAAKGTCRVEYNVSEQKIYFYWDGSSGTGGSGDNSNGGNDSGEYNPGSGGTGTGTVSFAKAGDTKTVPSFSLPNKINTIHIQVPDGVEVELELKLEVHAGSDGHGTVKATQEVTVKDGRIQDFQVDSKAQNGSLIVEIKEIKSGSITKEQFDAMVASITVN